GAQIFDELIGLQDVGADLVAPADVRFLADEGARFGFLLFEFDFVEPRTQHIPAYGAVLVLRFFGLRRDRDAGGQMRDAHRAFRLVDVLAARAARTEHVDAYFLFGNVDFDGLVDHRIDGDGREAGVAARV